MTIAGGSITGWIGLGGLVDQDAGAGVFPDAAEVLYPVVYGPTGADYTGTFGTPPDLDFLDPASALVWLLGQSSDVTGLVAARRYPERAPQAARLPYVIVSKASAEHEHHMSAASGLSRARLDATWFGRNPGETHALLEAGRQAADGWRGTVTGASGALVVRMLHVLGDSTDVVYLAASDQAVWMGVQQWDMWCELVVPEFD
jgi:hypothetical protein